MKKKEKQECQKCKEYLDGWKRALADYENLKRDIDSIKENNRIRIKIDLAENLLAVIDNFDQAVNHIPDLSALDEENMKTINVWLQGVVYIKKQFENAMLQMGIEQIEVGEEPDETLYEIVGEQIDDTKKDGQIIRVIQSGWKIGDRILRPVKVIINKINKE
jgi:molecular chaperone GrpE